MYLQVKTTEIDIKKWFRIVFIFCPSLQFIIRKSNMVGGISSQTQLHFQLPCQTKIIYGLKNTNFYHAPLFLAQNSFTDKVSLP